MSLCSTVETLTNMEKQIRYEGYLKSFPGDLLNFFKELDHTILQKYPPDFRDSTLTPYVCAFLKENPDREDVAVKYAKIIGIIPAVELFNINLQKNAFRIVGWRYEEYMELFELGLPIYINSLPVERRWWDMCDCHYESAYYRAIKTHFGEETAKSISDYWFRNPAVWMKP